MEALFTEDRREERLAGMGKKSGDVWSFISL